MEKQNAFLGFAIALVSGQNVLRVTCDEDYSGNLFAQPGNFRLGDSGGSGWTAAFVGAGFRLESLGRHSNSRASCPAGAGCGRGGGRGPRPARASPSAMLSGVLATSMRRMAPEHFGQIVSMGARGRATGRSSCRRDSIRKATSQSK